MYLGLTLLWMGCGSSEDTAVELSDIEKAWAEYDLPEPDAETVKWLPGNTLALAGRGLYRYR